MYRLWLFKLFERLKSLVYIIICSVQLKLKNCLIYMTLTEFEKLNATCHISPETAELRIWTTLKEMRQMRICGEQDF